MQEERDTIESPLPWSVRQGLFGRGEGREIVDATGLSIGIIDTIIQDTKTKWTVEGLEWANRTLDQIVDAVNRKEALEKALNSFLWLEANRNARETAEYWRHWDLTVQEAKQALKRDLSAVRSAHRAHNPTVAGSIPAGPTIRCKYCSQVVAIASAGVLGQDKYLVNHNDLVGIPCRKGSYDPVGAHK